MNGPDIRYRQGPRLRRCRSWVAGAVAFLSLAYCASLPFGLVSPHRIGPISFRNFRHLENPDWRFLAASCLFVPAVIGLARLGRRGPGTAVVSLGLMVLLAVALQFSVAFVAPARLGGMLERMRRAPHAPLTDDAYKVATATGALRDFERLVQAGDHAGGLSWQARTKPPGLLAFYVGMRLVSEHAGVRGLIESLTDNRLFGMRFRAQTSAQANREYFQALAALVMTCLAGLVLVPLYVLARQCLRPQWALLACGLYLLAPNVLLVVMHTDQNLVVLATLAPVAAAAVGLRRAGGRGCWTGAGWTVAAGLALGLGLQLTYAALFAAALVVLLIPAGTILAGRGMTRGPAAVRAVVSVPAFGISAGATLLLCQWLGGYDWMSCYRLAMSQHARIYAWVKLPAEAWVTLSEFVQWVGLPICGLALAWLIGAPSRMLRGRARFTDCLAVVLAVCWCLLVLSGKTRAETARLWIFLVPYLALLSVCTLKRYWGRSAYRAFAATAVLQMAVVLATKLWMDFS